MRPVKRARFRKVTTMTHRSDDVAFDLRYRAAVQDMMAQKALSAALRMLTDKSAWALRVQANLIEQGVPIERVLDGPA